MSYPCKGNHIITKLLNKNLNNTISYLFKYKEPQIYHCTRQWLENGLSNNIVLQHFSQLLWILCHYLGKMISLFWLLCMARTKILHTRRKKWSCHPSSLDVPFATHSTNYYWLQIPFIFSSIHLFCGGNLMQRQYLLQPDWLLSLWKPFSSQYV